MSDPKLQCASVQINYTADDGYSSGCFIKSGEGSFGVDGKPRAPEAGLLDAIEELARITALFGFEAEARQTVDEAFARVSEWRAQRVA